MIMKTKQLHKPVETGIHDIVKQIKVTKIKIIM